MRTTEDLLLALLENHFNSDHAEFKWNYIEGTAIADVDPDLARELDDWLTVARRYRTTP